MPRLNRKRQTRLSFSPLPSSSPAAAIYPEQIKERAASVRYDDSSSAQPIKKRRLDNDASSRSLLSPTSSSPAPNSSNRVRISATSEMNAPKIKISSIFSHAALPTPVASSQVDDMEPQSIHEENQASECSTSSEDKIRNAIPRRLFGHQKQANLSLHDDLSDTSSSGSLAKPDEKARKRGPESGTDETDKPIKLDLSDEDRLRSIVISSSEDESDHLKRVAQVISTQPSPTTPTTPPVSRPSSSRRARQRREASSQKKPWLSQATEPRPQIQSPSKSHQKLKPAREFAVTPRARTKAQTPRRSTRSSTMDQRRMQPPAPSDSDENDSAQEDITSNFDGKDAMPAVDSASDEDSDVTNQQTRASRRTKPQKIMKPLAKTEERDSSSDDVVTPVRRRRPSKLAKTSPSKPSGNSSNQSADDIQEDLDDLKDSEVRSNRTRGLQRTPKKTKIQQQLELLRRRRSGQNVIDVSSASEDPAPSRPRREHPRRTSTERGASEQTQESEEDYNEPIVHADEDLDQYDDDFVTEDDDEPLGAPEGLDQMPFEFTRHAHKKPVEHFKDVVEWMVHNKLNPAFPRDDPVYQVAIFKLDDEVKGTAGSKFMSAVWRPDFLAALKERPDISYIETPGVLEHCAACNRTNHPAKFQLVFSGRSYDRKSLEDVSDDEDDEDGSTGEDDTWGYNPKTFYVGRTCRANAEIAHSLQHWRYALNQWVLGWLARKGYMTSQKIVERERWSTSRRGEYANGIVDDMQSSGEMRTLYKELKENLQAAREAKNERYDFGRR